MTAADAAIEILIPNWNGKKLLAECLQSLTRQTNREFCVTVIDNGSSDGSVAWLRDSYPEVKILQFETNRGFSAAVNEGIRSSSADWIFLLNNDIEVATDCLAYLLDAVMRYPEYRFFALKMLSYHQRDIIDGAGDAVLRGGVGYRVGTLELDRAQYDRDRDVFGACAGAALYHRSFFDKCGLFDEDFFAYLEDVDLNMRAAQLGLRCRYLAGAVVYHIGSATTGSKINPTTVRLSTKNTINILVKNYPISLVLRFFLVIYVYQCMWFFFTLKKRQLGPYFQGILEAVRQLPTMYGKRREIKEKRLIRVSEFAWLLTLSEQEAVQSIMDRRSALGKSNLLLEIYMKIFCHTGK